MNTNHMSLWQIEMLPWYAFLIVWIAAALRSKPAKTVEPLAARIFTGAVTAAAFVLLFNASFHMGVLRHRMLPSGPAQEWTGIVLTFAGAVIAIWARLILGGNWSAMVTVKVGHELIRSGPYAYVRHPIYSGLLLAVIGTAIEIAEWRGLLAIVLASIALLLKAQREERFLTGEFGENYAQYRQGTGLLVPKV